MATVQELQATIVEVAIVARIRANTRRIASQQVIEHGVDAFCRELLEDSESYAEALQDELTARDKGLTLSRSVEILKQALRDIRLGA